MCSSDESLAERQRNLIGLEKTVILNCKYRSNSYLSEMPFLSYEVRKMRNNIRRWKLQLRLAAIGIILLLLLTHHHIMGQSSALQLITTEYGVSNLSWSPDSNVLLFYSDEAMPSARAYVRSSGVITSAISVVPKLSEEEFKFFDIYGDNDPTGGIYSISPDNRYVVYIDASPIDRGEGALPDPYAFFLGDRQQRLKIPTGDQLAPWLSVYWNTDGTAFIVIGVPATEGEYPAAYLTGITTNFTTDLATTITRGFSQFVLDRRSYNVSTSVYHIAPDGNSVLLKAYDLDSAAFDYDQTLSLINYDVVKPSRSQILLREATNTRAAQFRFDATNQVLLINERGLLELDTATDQTTILDPSLNSEWVYEASFSPDGRWIAVTHVLDDSTTQLFVGDVAQLLGSSSAVLPSSSGTPMPTAPHRVGLNDLRWDMDGNKFALALADGTIDIVQEGDRSKAVLTAAQDQIISLDWSPTNPNLLAVAPLAGLPQILSLNVSTFSVVRELAIDQDFVGFIRWSPDGQKIATLGVGGNGRSGISSVKVWDAATGTMLLTYKDNPGYDYYTDISWNPRQAGLLALAAITNQNAARLIVWDTVQDRVVWTKDDPQLGMLSLDWSSDGLRLATGTQSSANSASLTIWDGTDGTRLSDISIASATIVNLDWSPNADIALIRSDSTLEIREGKDYQIKTTIANVDPYAAWSTNGDLAYRHKDGTIQVITDLGDIPTIVTQTIIPTSLPR